MSNFKTDVKGSVVLIYKADNLKTPIATVNSADDVEDMRGQVLEAVQTAFNLGAYSGYHDAKSEPLKDDPRVMRAISRAMKAGREQYAAQLRTLLDEGKNTRGKKKNE